MPLEFHLDSPVFHFAVLLAQVGYIITSENPLIIWAYFQLWDGKKEGFSLGVFFWQVYSILINLKPEILQFATGMHAFCC